jgi:excisionase family DNA binding protein
MAKPEVRIVRSTSQVAVAMNVTRRTVQNWCERGQLDCFKTPGGQYRIAVDEQGLPLAAPEE